MSNPSQTCTKTDTSEQPTRHPDYYLKDGNTILQVRQITECLFQVPNSSAAHRPLPQVEQTLFKIHQYFLENYSTLFNAMFAMPPKERDETEGSSDDNPIFVDAATAEEFANLVTLFYPKYADFDTLPLRPLPDIY